MSSRDNLIQRCPICHTDVAITITYGVYPCKTLERADCPVCGNELFHENITGDIDTRVHSLEQAIEPFKSEYLNKQKCNE